MLSLTPTRISWFRIQNIQIFNAKLNAPQPDLLRDFS